MKIKDNGLNSEKVSHFVAIHLFIQAIQIDDDDASLVFTFVSHNFACM